MTTLPLGFRSHVANIGVKDDTDDFVVIAADRAVPVAGMFTKSRFAGPSVTLSRAQIADGRAHARAIARTVSRTVSRTVARAVTRAVS